MLKSIYFISSHFHLYEVCIQGERGEYGSSLAKARFMLAPIAQPCMHPAAAVKADGEADTAQIIRGESPYRSPEPRGRYARTSEPP